MKHLKPYKSQLWLALLPLALLFAVVQNCHAQEAPKKANTAVISCSECLIEFAKYLQDEGFDIDRLDKELGSVQTNFKEVGEANTKLKLSARLRGNELIVKGVFFVNGLGENSVENRGMSFKKLLVIIQRLSLSLAIEFPFYYDLLGGVPFMLTQRVWTTVYESNKVHAIFE